MPDFPRRLAAEALGTGFLLAAVVGSGIMAEQLSGGNNALALLGNTLPTGAILAVLILIFGPISGAHLNPAVSIAFALRGELPWRCAPGYIAAQIVGGIIGVWAVHLMFELPVWQVSLHIRTGAGQWFAEFVATLGLLLTILGCVVRHASRRTLCSWPLHHLCLLVYGLDIVRQPRRDDCSLDLGHVRRYRPGQHNSLYRGTASRNDRSSRRRALVLALGRLLWVQSRQNEAIDFKSALTSTSDISLRRGQ